MLPSVVTPPASAAAEPLVKSSTQRGPLVAAPGGLVEMDVRVDRTGQQQLPARINLGRRRHLPAKLRHAPPGDAHINIRLATRRDDAPAANYEIHLGHWCLRLVVSRES